MIYTLMIIGALLLSLAAFNWAPNAEAGSSKEDSQAKIITPTDGGMPQVVLTPQAAKRLGIEIAQVRSQKNGEEIELVIPYAAMIYHANGESWTYTNPKPLVYERHQVVIDRIDGDDVILTEGPPVGTNIVIIGVAELHGVETGLGK